MSKILFIDTETTGFSADWSYIIEVAAILYDEETKTKLDSFHEFIRPKTRIPAKITEITGITDFQVRNCRSERSVLQDFFEWIQISNPDKITAYNSSFDKRMLEGRGKKYNLISPDYPWFDMMKYGRKMKKEGKIENYKQVSVAKFLGINYVAHTAIEDVSALIRVFEALGLNQTKKQVRESLGF